MIYMRMKGCIMKTLTVRNVPDGVYEELTAWAEESHRSLQQQVRYILEQDVKLRERAVLEAAAEYRTKLANRNLGDVVEDVRKDRQR